MEKYCKSCGTVFNELKFKICPYCGGNLYIRYGRQPIPRKLRHEVFKRDGYRCRECGASKDETILEIDHIIPVARGGTNDIDNLQTLCRECNRMKHTDEWVGGQRDLKIAKNELSNLKEQLNKYEEKINDLTDEDEIIECKFNIIKLNESIKEVEQKINLLKEEEQIAKKKQIEKEEKKKMYMKLYVELDDESINLISDYLNRNSPPNEKHANKDEFIKYLANHYSYDELKDIKQKELKRKLNMTERRNRMKNRKIKGKKEKERIEKLYTKLYAELDDESISLISDYLNRNSPPNEKHTNKDELIWHLANHYSYYEIIAMKEKEKTKRLENKRKERIQKQKTSTKRKNETGPNITKEEFKKIIDDMW